MESKAKLAGHPIHPMLIVFPLGLLGGAVLLDLISLVRGPFPNMAVASYWCIFLGVALGVVAAVFGFVDWLAVPRDTRAWRVGLWHGVGNVVVVLLFAGSWLLRRGDDLSHLPNAGALVLSFSGFLLALVTGWLGGELVHRLGVGVDRGAHLDAPSSLSGKPAQT